MNNILLLFLKFSMYSLFTIVALLFFFLLLSSNKIIGGNLCIVCFIIFVYLVLCENIHITRK